MACSMDILHAVRMLHALMRSVKKVRVAAIHWDPMCKVVSDAVQAHAVRAPQQQSLWHLWI